MVRSPMDANRHLPLRALAQGDADSLTEIG